ncbi:transposase domain-containing protein [Ciceribacter azotifigens]|uniref:transposase domain-containing protein n=1 Tax=Ciceribacter azotifigens TaxID=2069303 RepID=UPI003A877438
MAEHAALYISGGSNTRRIRSRWCAGVGAFSLTEAVTLDGIDPETYLRGALARIADHPIVRFDHLLPWNCQVTPKVA